MKKMLLALFALFSLSACSAVQENTSGDIATGLTVYKDQWVRRSPPEVYVYPASGISAPPTVMMVPFRLTQPMNNADQISYGVSRVFWQTWSAMELFDYIEFCGEAGPFRRDVALNAARKKGAQMLIGGFVTHISPGGTVSDTTLSVQVEAYDVQSGLLIWSFGQGGLMPGPEMRDFIIFTTKTRLPGDPVHAISQALAVDMGKLIIQWTRNVVPSDKNEPRLPKRQEASHL